MKKLNLQKEVQQLRAIYDKVIAKKDGYQLEIEKRTAYQYEKSDKWQESEKGEDYIGTTSEMDDRFQDLEIEVEKLDEAITELYDLSEHLEN
jgi:threonine synthase